MSIIVYSKEGCVYCDKAKSLLDDLQVPYKVHVLNPSDTDYVHKKEMLFDKHNHRSFPLIYIGDTFIGGYIDLQHSVATLRFHELAKQIGIEVPLEF